MPGVQINLFAYNSMNCIEIIKKNYYDIDHWHVIQCHKCVPAKAGKAGEAGKGE
jgi:hypothetical protein